LDIALLCLLLLLVAYRFAIIIESHLAIIFHLIAALSVTHPAQKNKLSSFAESAECHRVEKPRQVYRQMIISIHYRLMNKLSCCLPFSAFSCVFKWR